MTSIVELLLFILNVAWYVIIAHALMSWLISMQVLNIQSAFVRQIWYALNQLLDPIYSRMRNVLPSTGVIDFSPLILIFCIYFLQTLIRNNLIA
ncbi:MAG: YggT family protein [Rhodobacteraceae bacterium]|nr:YggT family protein [Paracoccaceae bacterium]